MWLSANKQYCVRESLPRQRCREWKNKKHISSPVFRPLDLLRLSKLWPTCYLFAEHHQKIIFSISFPTLFLFAKRPSHLKGLLSSYPLQFRLAFWRHLFPLDFGYLLSLISLSPKKPARSGKMTKVFDSSERFPIPPLTGVVFSIISTSIPSNRTERDQAMHHEQAVKWERGWGWKKKHISWSLHMTRDAPSFRFCFAPKTGGLTSTSRAMSHHPKSVIAFFLKPPPITNRVSLSPSPKQQQPRTPKREPLPIHS